MNCQRPDVAWYKMNASEICEMYTDKVESALTHVVTTSSRYLDKLGIKGVEILIDLLKNVMLECSKCLPKKGFNKAVKPYWTKDLSELSKPNKQILRIWKMAGCPRDENN